MKTITFKQYRSTDLVLWTIMVLVSEAIATVATTKWFPGQPIAISVSLMFTCVVMLRWGAFAALPAIAGGAVYCLASGAGTEQYVIYIVGNLFALLALLIVRLFGKEQVRTKLLPLLTFTGTAYVAVSLGRGLVSMMFGSEWKMIVAFLTTDVLSLLFAVVVVWLLRNVDGMTEDQKAYLFRIEREEKEKNGFENDDQERGIL